MTQANTVQHPSAAPVDSYVGFAGLPPCGSALYARGRHDRIDRR